MTVKELETQLLPVFCSRDLVAIAMEITGETGTRGKVIVASGYSPHGEDDSLPSDPVIRLMQYCQKKQFPLILGSDANVHHTVQGNKHTYKRSETLGISGVY